MKLKKVLLIILTITLYFHISMMEGNNSTTIILDNTIDENYGQYKILLPNLDVDQHHNHFFIIFPDITTFCTTNILV